MISDPYLASSEGGGLQVGATRIHLGNDSSLISKHHTNWRIQAIRSLDREDRTQQNEDLHYSSVVSLSAADVLKIKAMLVETIESFNATVAPSKEELVQCLALDFFKV